MYLTNCIYLVLLFVHKNSNAKAVIANILKINIFLFNKCLAIFAFLITKKEAIAVNKYSWMQIHIFAFLFDKL